MHEKNILLHRQEEKRIICILKKDEDLGGHLFLGIKAKLERRVSARNAIQVQLNIQLRTTYFTASTFI